MLKKPDRHLLCTGCTQMSSSFWGGLFGPQGGALVPNEAPVQGERQVRPRLWVPCESLYFHCCGE